MGGATRIRIIRPIITDTTIRGTTARITDIMIRGITVHITDITGRITGRIMDMIIAIRRTVPG